VSELDAETGALLARNPYNVEFAGQAAFLHATEPARSFTGDLGEFIGRDRTLANPAALLRPQLGGRVGPGLDPCGALQLTVAIEPGETRRLAFVLGHHAERSGASALAARYASLAQCETALADAEHWWTELLSAIQVHTPDDSFDLTVNRWLPYQTLSCRIWARSGPYQPGGAFGFRDQLQDVLSLVYSRPDICREQLLRCASRQFVEGDVQHWWHPPSGRGVRTRCSDDYLWLPLATARYVKATGDTGVLEESIHFLEGREVNAGDDSYYDLPRRSAEAASLYEHCKRAIVHGLRFGAHGLPLMGSGDWNDGMNLVGIKGAGESVWLGFFLCGVLRQFAEVARVRGDPGFAQRCDDAQAELRRNLDLHGWDGDWYRRAYFDDGAPLGSASNVECRIDSISQSWSVLSGAGDAAHLRMAMNAADIRLVRRDVGLVQLLDPPFDKTSLDPGYIRGYVPGVRENGGQY